MQNPRIIARFAGILSLLTIAGGIFAQGIVSDRLLVFTDAALTAKNVLANQRLFYVSFTVYLIEMACQIAGHPLAVQQCGPFRAPATSA